MGKPAHLSQNNNNNGLRSLGKKDSPHCEVVQTVHTALACKNSTFQIVLRALVWFSKWIAVAVGLENFW